MPLPPRIATHSHYEADAIARVRGQLCVHAVFGRQLHLAAKPTCHVPCTSSSARPHPSLHSTSRPSTTRPARPPYGPRCPHPPQDNNFPGSMGRSIGKADDNELALLHVPCFFNGGKL